MIQEINLPPLAYLVLISILLFIAYQILKTPYKTISVDTDGDFKKARAEKEGYPKYIEHYGAVIQGKAKIQ